MIPAPPDPSASAVLALDNIVYVRQMLGELRNVAHGDGAEMPRYLIEMAYVEAGDLTAGQRASEPTPSKARRSTPTAS